MKKRRVRNKFVEINGKTYLPVKTQLKIGRYYGYHSAILKINGKKVGSVNIQKSYNGQYYYNSMGQYVQRPVSSLPDYETHSHLDEIWHGFGFGIALYDKAIEYALKKKKTIGSSSYPSTYARRVWMSKTLRKKYRIEYSKSCKRFVVKGLRHGNKIKLASKKLAKKSIRKRRPVAKR